MQFRFNKMLLVWIMCLLVVGCTSDSNQSNQEETPPETNTPTATDAQKILSKLTVEQDFLQKEVPLLDSLLKADEQLHKTVNNYAFSILNADKIVNNEVLLKQLFKFRNDSILPALTEHLLKPMEGELFYEVGEQLEKELNHIGLTTVVAEGMFLDLAQYPMLQKEVDAYASEPYKLYQQFNDAHAASVGGEYTFLDLRPEQQMILIGERMRKDFPDHEYTKQIEGDFRFALRTMTDVHKLLESTGGSLIYGNLNVDFYPFATENENYTTFIKNHADSQYHGVVQDIYESVSEIQTNKGGSYADLYLVVIDWLANSDDEDAPPCHHAVQEVYQYLDKGIAIPHALPLKKDGKTMCALTYRFYADRKKAEKALATIKPQASNAKLVHAVYYDNELMWGVE